MNVSIYGQAFGMYKHQSPISPATQIAAPIAQQIATVVTVIVHSACFRVVLSEVEERERPLSRIRSLVPSDERPSPFSELGDM
jgi:hypothetical protein